MLDNLIVNFREISLSPAIGVEVEFYITQALTIEAMESACKKQSRLFYKIEKEKGENQYEIQLTHSTNIKQLIEEIYLVKKILEETAQKHGSEVDFSSKPYLDGPGNAFHINLSLHNNNKKPEKKYSLYAIAGLCERMLGSMLDFAPYVTCYNRFQHPDINTPTTVSWGYNNRSTAIRVIDNRIEHRVPCADSIPEDVIIRVLEGALQGILNKRKPTEPVYGLASQKHYNLTNLPITFTEAKRCYNKY